MSPADVFDMIFTIAFVYQNWFEEFGYIYHYVKVVACPRSLGPSYTSYGGFG